MLNRNEVTPKCSDSAFFYFRTILLNLRSSLDLSRKLYIQWVNNQILGI